MTRALIAGGGIAGTVAAIALRKAGIEVVINEAYRRDAEGVGAILGLQLNGMDALRCLELDQLVREHGADILTRTMRLGSGRTLVAAPVHERLADSQPAQLVKRAGLYRVLRDEAVRRGADMRYGRRLIDAEDTEDGVVARFDDGSVETGDLLVGADGVHSRTREIIDPHAPKPRYTGMLDSSGCAKGVRVDDLPGSINMILGKKAFFGYLPQPAGEVWWFTHPPRAKEPGPGELAAISPARWRADMLELFSGDRSPAVDLINATDELFPPWPSYDLSTVPNWHRGRMIIIGDAAHPVSPGAGQGAALAIEDAVVLAKCLRDTGEPPAAFRAYEGLRRERVERVAALGRKNGGDVVVGPIRRVVRDLVLRVVLRDPSRSRSRWARWQWISEHHLEWD